MPWSPDPPVSVLREAPASTSYKRPEHPLVEPRNQTEPQGSGASTMTWEPQQRVDGGPDRPRGRCSAARVYSLALGLARLLGSTGRKRGPGDTPSTLRKARTSRATSHPCPRGLLWPQGRRHQPTWGRQWCPGPGEPPRSGGGKAGATAERAGGMCAPGVSRPEKQQREGPHAGRGGAAFVQPPGHLGVTPGLVPRAQATAEALSSPS